MPPMTGRRSSSPVSGLQTKRVILGSMCTRLNPPSEGARSSAGDAASVPSTNWRIRRPSPLVAQTMPPRTARGWEAESGWIRGLMRWEGMTRWEVHGGSTSRRLERSAGELTGVALWIKAHEGLEASVERRRRGNRISGEEGGGGVGETRVLSGGKGVGGQWCRPWPSRGSRGSRGTGGAVQRCAGSLLTELELWQTGTSGRGMCSAMNFTWPFNGSGVRVPQS